MTTNGSNFTLDWGEFKFQPKAKVYRQLSPAELVEETIKRGEGVLADTGALMIDTGQFKGRAPKDKYTVKDHITADKIWWGEVNQPFDPVDFDRLLMKVFNYLEDKDLFVRDAYVCADKNYRLNLRVINENPWGNLFAYNMFLRPTAEELINFSPDWLIIHAPGFKANPQEDKTIRENFAILNFSRRILLIGGTGYTGEIKKGIFTVLNFLLPVNHGVFPMHCSANVGPKGDTAIFFGLSGTGKTTLSSDPNRQLIGDDEHGWSDNTVFNFEGGCYAKCINLSHEQEPLIWNAIKFGSLLENTEFYPGTRKVDYTNASKTENTRVSYPVEYIENIKQGLQGEIPKNIFFLTCDAFGVLPPIARLSKAQAMYQFISGYTAKVAGTEAGITEPQTTFSACFGQPFLPLHPTYYAEMLGKKMEQHNVNIWLVNTGWTGGSYGVGSRIKLKYTRAMINAALNGDLDNVEYWETPFFGLQVPVNVPGVPDEILNPRNTWKNPDEFDRKAMELAEKFVKNFEKYRSFANEEILTAAPKVSIKA